MICHASLREHTIISGLCDVPFDAAIVKSQAKTKPRAANSPLLALGIEGPIVNDQSAMSLDNAVESDGAFPILSRTLEGA